MLKLQRRVYGSRAGWTAIIALLVPGCDADDAQARDSTFVRRVAIDTVTSKTTVRHRYRLDGYVRDLHCSPPTGR